MTPKKQKEKNSCCEICQNYWTCEKKWYRGEKGQENICCDLCSYYAQCWVPAPKASVKK